MQLLGSKYDINSNGNSDYSLLLLSSLKIPQLNWW